MKSSPAALARRHFFDRFQPENPGPPARVTSLLTTPQGARMVRLEGPHAQAIRPGFAAAPLRRYLATALEHPPAAHPLAGRTFTAGRER